jgi:hypothetical protein
VANETPFPFFIKTDERRGPKRINVKRCHKSVGGIADGVGGALSIASNATTQEAAASRAFTIVYNAKTQKEFS